MTANAFPYGGQGQGAAAPRPLFWRRRKGQATVETVLLLPIFFFFMFAFAKLYALLILVQKIEIASYYAARRWQLESHRNVNFQGDDANLQADIQERAMKYVGARPTTPQEQQNCAFLGLCPEPSCPCNGNSCVGPPGLAISRTQVWQIVTLTVCTNPVNMPFMQNSGFGFEVTKYVPNRDRPIAFVLPGM